MGWPLHGGLRSLSVHRWAGAGGSEQPEGIGVAVNLGERLLGLSGAIRRGRAQGRHAARGIRPGEARQERAHPARPVDRREDATA